MKQEERRKILRWMGIFSIPWMVLGVLLWLATRPEKPVPGTETVAEGVMKDSAAADYPGGSPGSWLSDGARAYLILAYDDGTEEFFWEADIGAESVGWETWDRSKNPDPRVRLTVAEERGCGYRVYTKKELLPGS